MIAKRDNSATLVEMSKQCRLRYDVLIGIAIQAIVAPLNIQERLWPPRPRCGWIRLAEASSTISSSFSIILTLHFSLQLCLGSLQRILTRCIQERSLIRLRCCLFVLFFVLLTLVILTLLIIDIHVPRSRAQGDNLSCIPMAFVAKHGAC